jgi:hypothetical protein
MVVPLVALACTPTGGGGGGVYIPPTTTTTSTTFPWTDPPPQDEWDFDMNCSVYVANAYHPFPQSASVFVQQPDFVSQGQDFETVVWPGTFIVPFNVDGYPVKNLVHFEIGFVLSPNVQFLDSIMSAGINDGPGYPSLKVQGGLLIYSVPGPFTPGDTVQLPAVHLTFKATGPVSGSILTKMKYLKNVVIINNNTPNPFQVGDTCTLADPSLVFGITVIQ